MFRLWHWCHKFRIFNLWLSKLSLLQSISRGYFLKHQPELFLLFCRRRSFLSLWTPFLLHLVVYRRSGNQSVSHKTWPHCNVHSWKTCDNTLSRAERLQPSLAHITRCFVPYKKKKKFIVFQILLQTPSTAERAQSLLSYTTHIVYCSNHSLLFLLFSWDVLLFLRVHMVTITVCGTGIPRS